MYDKKSLKQKVSIFQRSQKKKFFVFYEKKFFIDNFYNKKLWILGKRILQSFVTFANFFDFDKILDFVI